MNILPWRDTDPLQIYFSKGLWIVAHLCPDIFNNRQQVFFPTQEPLLAAGDNKSPRKVEWLRQDLTVGPVSRAFFQGMVPWNIEAAGYGEYV